jgi:hypothetical protein
MHSTRQRRGKRQEIGMSKVILMPRARATVLACGAALLWATGVALAADSSPGDRPAPTKAQREQMAAAHEKVAACLRSDKPIDDCRAEMKQMHDSMKHSHHHDTDQKPSPDSSQK